MNVVHARPDALVMAYRGRLHEEMRRELYERARMAVQHGKVACNVAGLDWELGFSRIPRRWSLVRKDHVRVLVDLQAPGAVWSPERDTVHVKRETVGVELDGPYGRSVPVERTHIVAIETEYQKEPGWTLELVFYAQWLADRSLGAAIEEARAIARGFGKCFEERVRRLDLCADIAGATVHERLLKRLVTRSRARVDPKEAQLSLTEGTSFHRHRQLTGITVGSKNWIARLYDKREELKCKHGSAIVDGPDGYKIPVAKSDREEERWRAGGWNGIDPVMRVEFELHGEALRELGIFKGDEIREPVVRRVTEMVDGEPSQGKLQTGVLYTLEEYTPRIWATCLEWLRIVRGQRTRSGKEKQKTRCDLDERWVALHAVKWQRPFPGSEIPIKRFRKRSHVAAAQAVGALSSLAAAHGQLPLFSEDPDDYAVNAAEKLQGMLTALLSVGQKQIAAGLVDRWGSESAAAEHLAIRLNAARARFALARTSLEPKETGPPWLTDSIKQCSSETSEPIPNCA